MTKSVKVELTLEERDVMLKHVPLFDPGLEEKIRKKRSRNGYVNIDLCVEELTDLLGWVAAEANHTSGKWVEACLSEIYDQLERFERGLKSFAKRSSDA